MQRLRTGQIFTSSPTKQQENRAWSGLIKEKVSVVRFQIEAYKISTKHVSGKDTVQSHISVHEFSGGILCDRRE